MVRLYCITVLSALFTCSYAQTYNADIPFGQLTYKVDPHTNSSTLLDSKLHYQFYNLVLDLNSKSKLSDGKLSYKDKKFSLLSEKGNFYYDSMGLKIAYLSNNIKDYWGRNVVETKAFWVTGSNFSIKTMDNYSEYQFKFDNLTLKNIQSLDRQELALGLKEKTWCFDEVYSPKLEKNFINFDSTNLHIKSIFENGTSYETLSYKNLVLGYGPDQSFVNYKYDKNIEIKYDQVNKTSDYSIRYYNLGVENNHLFLNIPVKKVVFQLSDDANVDSVNYNDVYQKTKVNIKYSNKFNVDDFYLNQALFDIYGNNYSLVNKTHIVNNNALNVNLENSTLSFKIDLINDVYNVAFKFKEVNFGFSKDQINKKITLSDNNKNGSLGIGYDVLKHQFVTFTAGYSVKF
jgi:hypothetical protein